VQIRSTTNTPRIVAMTLRAMLPVEFGTRIDSARLIAVRIFPRPSLCGCLRNRFQNTSAINASVASGSPHGRQRNERERRQNQ
jgi:hypothetical protein